MEHLYDSEASASILPENGKFSIVNLLCCAILKKSRE